tara:strand:- start:236 stop:379 length:144 start_codon:yes stop_codon:yes gene_type:complete
MKPFTQTMFQRVGHMANKPPHRGCKMKNPQKELGISKKIVYTFKYIL